MNRLFPLLLAFFSVACGGDRTPAVTEDAGTDATPPFNPLGSDTSLVTSWTVNGGPASAASCDAAGIANIRLVFWVNGAVRDFSELTSTCSDGMLASGPNLAHGMYLAQWQALDASRNVVPVSTERFDLNAVPPTGSVTVPTVDFDTTDLPSNTLDVQLRFAAPDGSAPDLTCDAAGVGTMDYTLTARAEVVVTMDDAPCGDLEIADASAGDYELEVTGKDSGANAAWTGNCAFAVGTGGNIVSCNVPRSTP